MSLPNEVWEALRLDPEVTADRARFLIAYAELEEPRPNVRDLIRLTARGQQALGGEPVVDLLNAGDEGARAVRESLESLGPGEPVAPWARTAELANTWRECAVAQLMTDIGAGRESLLRAGELYQALGLPFGPFLISAITGSREAAEQAASRLSTLLSGYPLGSLPDEGLIGWQRAIGAPTQQVSALLTAASASDYDAVLRNIPLIDALRDAPQSSGVTPVGTTAQPIALWWAAGQGLAALNRQEHQARTEVRELIAELAQAHGRQLRYAQLDNYHWSRAQASIDLIDLHLAGLVALTDRALRNSGLEGWSLEEFQAILPPLARVSLIAGLRLPSYYETGAEPSRESAEPQHPVSIGQETQVSSESQIAVHWREEEYVYPPASFIAQANASDPSIFDRFSEDRFPECFTEYADMLSWDKRWDTILDTSNAPFWRWFVGGKLNVSYNCVDRHLEKHKNKAALIWVPEPESAEPVAVTYQDLYRRVNEFAALLRDFAGLKVGDRVTLHMPMVPELPVAMLACARLGVIHCQVFSGFSGAACGQRIADSGSNVLITIDGYYRAGQMTDHKVKADEALDAAAKQGQEVEKVLVWRRHPGQYASQTPMVEGRDFFVDELLADYRGAVVPPMSMPAEAPLFLMYTSGTTGRPKGAQHSTGGYLAYVTGTSKYYQDIHPDDTYWCMADIGWITGHSYIVYGPLSLGTTSVIYEGTPNYPDAGRPWRIAQQLGVNIFHTSPTAIRMLRKVGPDEPAKYDYHFKAMTTVGEPIEPEVWRWYYETVGKGEAVILDTWWQTETGGFLGATLPALNPMKPGSCGPAALGIYLQILDENGDPLPSGSGQAGNITARNPWPGIMQTIWGQPDRFVSTYFAKYNKDPDSKDWRDWPYFAGDGAVQTEDGYFRILGRVDDVINVAGHRLGTKEIESAALTVPEVAEAAAVPVVDDVRGRAVELYVSLKPGYVSSAELAAKVSGAVEAQIGKIARPRNVWVVPDMPVTRSGKIMRRVIASVSNFADVGDITTLANPEVVEQIRHHVQSTKAARGEVPHKLTEAETEELKGFGVE